MVVSHATVLVTGATGKTGKLIAQKLKESDDFELRALTRSEKVLVTGSTVVIDCLVFVESC